MLNERDLVILEKIKNLKMVAMADESGAGCMAGDLVVAAVILDPNNQIDGLRDSKKLSARKRDILYDLIIDNAIDYNIVRISPQKIDEINILNARMLGFELAINGLNKVDYALIDGNKLPNNLMCKSDYIIKGDDKIDGIAAASILAKVTRDRIMLKEDTKYPQYGFAKHKGYVTKVHKEALTKYGITDIHRKSYKPVAEIISNFN
jgi:ribonuclease HII